MTTLRAHGFDSPAQLREYLDELDEEIAASDMADDASGGDPSSALREIGWLRKEVADLRAQLDFQDRQAGTTASRKVDTPAWIWLATALATTFVVTGVARILVKH